MDTWYWLSIAILVLVAVQLLYTWTQRLITHFRKRSEERWQLLRNKIITIIHNNHPMSIWKLESVLEPLGFSDQEVAKALNELISEGKLKM